MCAKGYDDYDRYEVEDQRDAAGEGDEWRDLETGHGEWCDCDSCMRERLPTVLHIDGAKQ